jgi:RecJ-like exonuclease
MAERFEKAARLLENSGRVRILSHYDADGISSAATLSKALLRKGIGFHVSLIKGLDEEFIGELNEEKNKVIVICDIGSGKLAEIERLNAKVVILDHHQTDEDSSKIMQINPHFFGMNGAYVLCSSMLCFLLSLALDERNWDLVPLALAGGIGDKQHLGGFKEANAKILESAVEKGEVEVRRGILLEGKAIDAISNSIDPYLGMEEKDVEKLLAETNIDPSTMIEDLGASETRALATHLTVRLVEMGARSESLENLVGEVFWIEKLERSANSLSSDVDACGRMKRDDIGVRLCFGDEEALKEIRELKKEYEDNVMAAVLKLRDGNGFRKTNLQFFYCDIPRIAGAVAGIGMQYFLDQEKATFGLSVLQNKTKVSCRGTKYLVGRGLDLATACRDAASAVNGNGGGHAIASGATIPKGQEDKFLGIVDEIIGAQFSGSGDRPT